MMHPCPLTPTLSPKGRGGRHPALRNAAGWTQPSRFHPGLHRLLTPRQAAFSLDFPPPGWGRVREGVAAMPAYRNDSQRLHARAQRAAMTHPEAALWRHLRNHRFLGLSVRRKAPVGPYIADFLIPSRRIAICILPETALWGTDHPPPGALERLGYSVLRPTADDLSGPQIATFLHRLAARVTP